LDKICAQCKESKADCLVAIDEITCKRRVLCAGCLSVQPEDTKLIASALDLFIKATNTKTAGGGLDGYKFMLDVIAMQMAEDHGYAPAIKRLQLAAEDMARREKPC
jgi:hypothetical protein